jgi:acyl-CoA synthetase (AMP-forming)/AMP-acid ligase II
VSIATSGDHKFKWYLTLVLRSAGCVYGPRALTEISTEREFMDLGRPIPGCEMRVTALDDPTRVVPDGESGELQVRGPMVFVRYYGNESATMSSFVPGGWFRTGDAGIIENGELRLSGRLKDTIIVHGVSFGVTELEAQLQAVDGVSHSFLAVAAYRPEGQDTEGFALFYGPRFSLEGEDAAEHLARTNRALKDVCVRMVTLPPTVIVPIPTSETEKTTLGKLSRARLVAQLKDGTLARHINRAEALLRQNEQAMYVAPQAGAERTVADIFAFIFELDAEAISANSNFFELGGTSIDVIT